MLNADTLTMSDSARLTYTLIAGLIALCVYMAPLTAGAQGWDDPVESDVRRYERPAAERDYDYLRDADRVAYADHVGWGARFGLGLVADPSMFLIDMAVPYNTGSGVSVGPRLQLGLSEKRTFLAPTLSIEYSHDLRSVVGGALGEIRPLVQAGIGFAWLEKEETRGENDDVDFLFDIGVGLEYPLTDGFAIASVFDFNVFPKEALNQDLIFTWQILQLRVQF